MKKITAALALAFALTTFPLAAHEEAGNAPVVPVLSVQANGEARVAPDEATVRLGVLAQAPTARAAMDAGQPLGQCDPRCHPQARRQGGGHPDLRAEPEPGLRQRARRCGAASRASRATRPTNVVSVRLEKLDLVGPVVDAGLAAGANRLDGVIFGLRNDEAARSTALTRAAEAARIKAETLARALRVRLVEIVEVVEGGVSVFTPMYKGARMAMETSMAADTPVSAGQVGIDANVTLRYRIEPCPAQGCP